MISTDAYLGRQYQRESYNCLHFTRDVWRDLTGLDITEKLASVLDPGSRTVRSDVLRAFRRLTHPVDPCIVLLERAGLTAHVGVFLRGRVLHLREDGAVYQPLDVASAGFLHVRFYTC